jgi:ketosteroid isomerase-like protein
MSQENVEVVREANRAWQSGDFDAVVRALDPDIQWHTAADEPDAGTHRGVSNVLSVIGGWMRAFEDFSVDVLELIDAGDYVVMPLIARGRPRGSEASVEVPETQVFTVRDGKIIDVHEYRTKAEALKAVGLEE